MPTPDWTTHFRQAIKSSRELSNYLEAPVPELNYPVFVPLPLADKIKKSGPGSALWLQFVPHEKELFEGGLSDPIADGAHSPTPMIVHRYLNRALYFPTQNCPVICRYCFRKNELNADHEAFGTQRNQALAYLDSHKEIQEVILSGGDPLILGPSKLRHHLEDLQSIQHLKYLRFHTRTPVILPERIDADFLKMLQNLSSHFSRVSIVVHCNHPDELDERFYKACQEMRESGAFVLSQSVLLKGVNDSLEELVQMYEKLIDAGVFPYYLHHPDDVKGAQHFMLSLEEGRALVSKLRQRLPGWAIPRYTIELPEGRGKVDAMNSLGY